MSIIKIAMVQQKAVPNDINKNLQLAIQYSREACQMGADMVLFPEMWSNGYAPPFEGAFDNPKHPNYEEERIQWLESAVSIRSEYVDTLQKLAKELRIGITITYLSKSKSKSKPQSKPQNAAIVIDRNGEILLDYAKVHTCDFSLEGLLQSGEEFKVCAFDGVSVGVMICYDREFPESARVLMLKGAELILVPNACDMNPARINQLSVRAFENMVGIAMANYPAKDWGNSCAFSPNVFDEKGGYVDNTIIRAEDTSEQIVMAEFDLEKIRAYRKAETWGNAYRKPHAYGALLGEEVLEPFVRSPL